MSDDDVDVMRLRAPRRDEAEAVLALLVARDTADFGRPDITLGDLLDEWGATEFDLERDAVVCETAAGEIAGYAIVWPARTFAAVAPDREGAGIGTELLCFTERRQRELGWDRHRTAIAGGNERAERLLTSRGYRLERSHWRMTVALDAGRRPRRRVDPDGIDLRPLDAEADAETLYELDGAAFAAVAGTEPESLTAFTEQHLRSHDLDARLSIVAERDGRAAGFALVRRWTKEATGYVSILAVAPAEQGRGVGRALLIRAFAAMRENGLSQAELGVAADNPKALKLYEAVGMRPRFQIDVYERLGHLD
jgi:mycothiol synthase